MDVKMTQITQITQGGLGNTKPNPATPKKAVRSRKWCLTINNYTEEEKKINNFIDDTKTQYVWGFEMGEEKTPHIQGYLEFKNAVSFTKMKKLFPRAHIEKARGSSKSNYDYCTKDGDFISNMDFQSFRDKLKQKTLDEFKDVKWKDWQVEILNILKEKPDNRKIYWYWEETGNVGKSYLCKYIALTNNIIIAEGKMGDIFNQINNCLDKGVAPNIILMDVPRSSMNFINYTMIEKVKNGLIYSGKYEGGQCIFPYPHVIIFANEEPDYTALSQDRFIVKKIE